jgi:hypothetical protein
VKLKQILRTSVDIGYIIGPVSILAGSVGLIISFITGINIVFISVVFVVFGIVIINITNALDHIVND